MTLNDLIDAANAVIKPVRDPKTIPIQVYHNGVLSDINLKFISIGRFVLTLDPINLDNPDK